MILIADSGATKTDWRLVDGAKIFQFSSIGFNPRSHDFSSFQSSLPQDLTIYKEEVKKLYYYGAGLYGEEVKEEVRQVLSSIFKQASIFTETDVLGAARSLFGKESGITCILGTGSAACFYDGSVITKRVPSLGYVLGDEGSGAYLGKDLLNRYLRGQLPENIQDKFRMAFAEINEEGVLKKVYQEHKANTYLSGFSSFIIDNQSDPFVFQLAYGNIKIFFSSFFGDTDKIKSEKIRFTGSVAYFLSNVIRKFATDHQLTVDLISQTPIAGLTLYHKENG